MHQTMERIGDTAPLELSEFKNLGPNTPTTHIDIPEKPENRVPTDRLFLYIFGGCVIFLIPFLIFTLVYSDVHRLFPDCMESCREDVDMTFNEDSVSCEQKCADLSNGEIIKEVNSWLYLTRGSVIFRLIVCSVMGAGVSVLGLYVFRYAVGCVVWMMIAGFFGLGFIMVILMWTFIADTSLGLTISIISTILLPVFGIIVYYGRNKIALVIVILTEAAKAVFAMPSLMIDPILMWLIETVIITLLLTTSIIMSTAGEEVVDDFGHTKYVMTGTMNFTMFLNFFVGIWGLMFVNGVENMIVAGAVSDWYFSEDKFNLNQPVRRSANIAYRFHLGTVAFGSLVILLTGMIRHLLKSLSKNRMLKYCIDHYLSMIQTILDYLTNNAYIVTAMHGEPFLKSGKRAASLIVHNFGKAISIRIIGRLTVGVSKFLIGFVTLLLSVPLFVGDSSEIDLSLVYIIIFVEATYIGATFLAVLEIAMDTILICFCEDLELNDGMARPYAMSNDLLEFIDNVKKAYGVNKEMEQFDAQKPQIV